MSKRVVITGLILAILLVLAVPVSIAWSADNGSVVCQVTPQLVSVTVSDGSVDYGSLALSAIIDTTNGANGINDTQTVKNSGNMNVDFNIKCSDAVGGNLWTPAVSQGTDQFILSYSKTLGEWPNLTKNYQSLATDVAPNGTQTFDLKLYMPTAVTDGNAKSITVSVQAIAHQ